MGQNKINEYRKNIKSFRKILERKNKKKSTDFCSNRLKDFLAENHQQIDLMNYELLFEVE